MYVELVYFYHYRIIFCYIFFSLLISVILVLVSVILRYLSIVKPDIDMSTSYECGFMPFDKVRKQVEIKFFLIGILFVLFDLEVVFILPWSICISSFDLGQFFLMIFFICSVALSFVYEIVYKCLDF